MANSNRHILSIKNTAIGYYLKKKKVLVSSDINIDISKGSFIGLVGENGIGKSTLLKSIIKHIPLLDGSILINQKNINDLNIKDFAKTVSVVLTETIQSKNMSVLELVTLGRFPYTNWIGRLTKQDLEAINNALELVGITNLKNKKCFELSDGQLQKVLIAKALAQDTDIIVLDEPTSHLDIYHKVSVLKLLKQLSENTGKTIIFSTHEINLAIQLCDKMIVMTSSKTHFNTPELLISDHVFDTLFPEDILKFDLKSGNYIVNK